MRVIARSTLEAFWKLYPDSEKALRAWYYEVLQANWRSPQDIKALYRNASILKGGRVVFNIAGNKYRLVVEVVYKIGVIYVKFVGSHKQYDKIDAEEYNDEPIQGYKNRG
ncbi:MAG: type II toxin-antitoxin system HigB family toxin [Breznakiellaceae bacterium]